MANETMVEVPGKLGLVLPDEGNTKVDTSKPLGSDVIPGMENATAEEKLFYANKVIAEKEALEKQSKVIEEQKKKEREKKVDEVTDDEPSDEEIQAKLDDLAKKEEKDLTDEDKAFITQYTNEAVDEVTAVKQDFENTYGFKLEGKYENNADGLKQLASEVAPKLAEQMFLNYLETVPHMKDFFNHIVKEGKGIETFLSKNEKPAFETIELKSPDGLDDADKVSATNNLKTLVSMDLKAKGNSEVDINSLIALYEANGSLYERAKASKENLAKQHKINVDAKLQEEQARIDQNNQVILAEFNTVKSIIEKNDFEGSSIPVGDIKAFSDAMLKPINSNGDTAMDGKRDKLTLAKRALLDYIVFKDFKINGLTTKAQPKSFTFRKANVENNARKGGRLNGGGNDGNRINAGNPSIDITKVNFNSLNKQLN